MKFILTTAIFALMVTATAFGQKTRSDLEKERSDIQQQIERVRRSLDETKKNKKETRERRCGCVVKNCVSGKKRSKQEVNHKVMVGPEFLTFW